MRIRAVAACSRCRSAKSKCSNYRPCSRCTKGDQQFSCITTGKSEHSEKEYTKYPGKMTVEGCVRDGISKERNPSGNYIIPCEPNARIDFDFTRDIYDRYRIVSDLQPLNYSPLPSLPSILPSFSELQLSSFPSMVTTQYARPPLPCPFLSSIRCQETHLHFFH